MISVHALAYLLTVLQTHCPLIKLVYCHTTG
jgi:hypothetical protein